MATGTIYNPNAFSEITSGIIGAIRAYKIGRIAMLDFETASLSSAIPANTNFSSVPAEYYPYFPVSFLDSAQKKRIILDAYGRLSSGADGLSAGVIRGVMTYITAN